MQKQKLIIIGASGHGKVIADIASLNGYKDISFLDDDESVKECMGYRVLGTSTDAAMYENADFIIAIGNAQIRRNMHENLKEKGLRLATLTHPNAVIAKTAQIGMGTVIMAGTVINPDCKIGEGCIINTGATVDHDCIIGDYVHVSVGAHIAGTVCIGSETCLGAGVVVKNNINICEHCIIGVGAVIVNDIRERGIYVGIPAKRMRK